MADSLNELRENLIVALQRSLRHIRQLLGFGVQDFGDVLGLTRQTINNLETGRTSMSPTQYVAIAAVIDHCIKNQPELLGAVSALLSSHAHQGNDGAFDMLEGGGLLARWFLSFPMGTRISALYGMGLGENGDFRRIAATCKVFLDDTVLMDKDFHRGADVLAKTMAECGNRFIIPLRATELLQERLFLPNAEKGLAAREGLKLLVQLQNQGLVDIRGDRNDPAVSDTLCSVFKRFKSIYRLALITQSSGLVRQLLRLNDDPTDFPILLFRYDAERGVVDWTDDDEEPAADPEIFAKQFHGWREL